jgi:hypothetical protein
MRIYKGDVLAEMRQRGIFHLHQVKYAIVETHGGISIMAADVIFAHSHDGRYLTEESEGEGRRAAARRELEEETTLVAYKRFIFFLGLNPAPGLFADIEHRARARASNEVAKCKWSALAKISTLSASVPLAGHRTFLSPH